MNDLYEDRLIVIKLYLEGEKPSSIYSSLHHSRASFFKWKRRYETAGLDGLRDLSTAPKHQAEHTPEAL